MIRKRFAGAAGSSTGQYSRSQGVRKADTGLIIKTEGHYGIPYNSVFDRISSDYGVYISTGAA